MRLTRVAFAVTAALACAAPAAAQDQVGAREAAATAAQAASVRQASPLGAIGFRGYFIFEHENMSASQSFDAVLGGSGLNLFGFGVDVTNLWRQVFARVTFTHVSRDGSRAFVDDSGNVFPLDIPITVTMTPFEIGGGWRLAPMGASGRITPYAGGGLVFLSYKEASSFAGSGDDVSESFHGFSVFGGVDVAVTPLVTAGADVEFRSIANAIGEAGVSAAFDETNLGGFVIRFMVGIRR